MKQLNPIGLTFLALVLLIHSSCCNDEDNMPAMNSFEEIADIAVFHGNLESDIVVVCAQGGPSTELIDQDLQQFIIETETQSALWVNVHQAQTKNPSLFISADITFEQAKQHNIESVANLNRVIDYYKNQLMVLILQMATLS